MNTTHHWSRMPGFFSLDILKRRALLKSLPLNLRALDFVKLDQGLPIHDADMISENVIGTFSLPLSVAANFVVDNEPVIVPMAIEEPSIVAACSKMAKLVAQNRGFKTSISRPLQKGQIQFFAVNDVDRALADFALHKDSLIAYARTLCTNMHARGGGVVDILARVVESRIGPMVLIEPVIDVVDAMGANFVNTVVENLSAKVAQIIDGTMGVRILSNLCEKRLATATCSVNFAQLATDQSHDNGELIARKLNALHALAEADVYRACTHNKGILNGIDAVAIATGNDFRAIEAGAHAYASMSGRYRPLTSLMIDDEQKIVSASLTMPLAVGVVGGIMNVHPGVKLAHAMLSSFSQNSMRLSSVMVSVGLAQCLAALVALSQDGIQKGHMKLHRKKLECSNISLAFD